MEAQAPRRASCPTPPPEAWLDAVRVAVETRLAALLALPDEERLDPRWARALEAARALALRPAKRVRPALVLIGWSLARDDEAPPEPLWRFAAALELLHTFLLIHDDVADRADTRRGGPSLHRCLGKGRRGADLAVVVGDHLYARALEAMLETGLCQVAEAVRYYLGVCRLTAAGQFLDLELSGSALAEVTLFQTLKVAMLKTARYGFAAPLVVGARLGGGGERLTAALERTGRQIGLAFQLRDDLLGLFGAPALTGKPTEDWAARKPTFPVIAAYARAPRPVRRELDALWQAAGADAAARARARELIELHGGRAAAEHAIGRASAAARRNVRALPGPATSRTLLDSLIVSLASRSG
jgi:geranylgeranyl diphosphate synthase type I